METVIIVVHLMIVVALVALVLLQRSEGGALGLGGGGNFMAARSQGNVLTRATAWLATAFFVTSITLTLIARFSGSSSLLDTVGVDTGGGGVSTPGTTAPPGDLLNFLGGTSASTTVTDTPPATVDVPTDASGAGGAATPATTVPTTPDVPNTP